jgi:glucose/arabinose dehydrogenase
VRLAPEAAPGRTLASSRVPNGSDLFAAATASRLLRMKSFLLACCSAVILATTGTTHAQSDLPLDRIKLPPGFTIEVLARVPNARALAAGPDGVVFVGSSNGRVYAVMPGNGSNAAARVTVLASGLDDPAGVAFHDGALYVGTIDRIVRIDNVMSGLGGESARPVLVTDKLPHDSHHGRKYIGFGPDGKLYVNVGAPCNVCEVDRDRYAVIMRMNADGSGIETFARGERNSVGFDWDPRTRELWFTTNGRDNMGDDVPPDTLNHAARAGLDFGFPYCHGGDIADPQFGSKRKCSEFTPPAQKLGPHVASLGMRFYTGTQFPAAYRDQVFIAEHGSWNRSQRIGYRVTLVKLDAQRRPVSYEPFAQGWLQNGSVWGRPADVLVATDGSLLVSDDGAGAVYRIRYRGS